MAEAPRKRKENRRRSRRLAQRARWVWLGADGVGILRLHRQGEHSDNQKENMW
jgi:hypothetical protein